MKINRIKEAKLAHYCDRPRIAEDLINRAAADGGHKLTWYPDQIFAVNVPNGYGPGTRKVTGALRRDGTIDGGSAMPNDKPIGFYLRSILLGDMPLTVPDMAPHFIAFYAWLDKVVPDLDAVVLP